MTQALAHIWDVPCADISIEYALTLLSSDEHARYQRLLIDEKKTEFAVTRAALRSALSQQLHCDPTCIDFTFGADGKPKIDGNPIFFNVSHSKQRALIITSPYPCGIDLEFHRQIDRNHIAKRYFHQYEHQAIQQLDASQQLAAFYRCWAHKEAAMKCSGLGMRAGSTSFQVAIDIVDSTDGVDSVNSTEKIILGNTHIDSNWHIYDLDIGSDYSAAVVSTHAVDLCMHGHQELALHD